MDQNNIQTFNFNGITLETIVIDDVPYFLGNDVANILGYARPEDALKQHVDKEDLQTLSYKAFGKTVPHLWNGNDYSNKTIINESGLYSLIFNSQLPNAKHFQDWVCEEVLPSIRKHGAYMTSEVIAEVVKNPDYLIALAKQLKESKNIEPQNPQMLI